MLLSVIQIVEWSDKVVKVLMDGDDIYASSQEMGLWWQPDPSQGPGPANTQLPKLGNDLFHFSKESLYCKIIYSLKYTFIYVSGLNTMGTERTWFSVWHSASSIGRLLLAPLYQVTDQDDFQKQGHLSKSFWLDTELTGKFS